MFTPVDLSQDGITTYRLIASNARIIGTVTVEVSEGNVTVGYALTAKQAKVSDEYITFFPDFESIVSLEPDDLRGQGYAFAAPISIENQLKGDTSQLLFIRNVVTYHPNGHGTGYFSDASKQHQELIQRLQSLLQE